MAQLLHVPAKKLDFPLGSPLHAEAAHQEDVGMDIVFSIQHITLEEGKAHKDRWHGCTAFKTALIGSTEWGTAVALHELHEATSCAAKEDFIHRRSLQLACKVCTSKLGTA